MGVKQAPHGVCAHRSWVTHCSFAMGYSQSEWWYFWDLFRNIIWDWIHVSYTREIHPLDMQPQRYCMLASTASAPRVTRCSLGLYWSHDLCSKHAAAERLAGWGMSSYLGQIVRGSEIWWRKTSAHSLSTTLRLYWQGLESLLPKLAINNVVFHLGSTMKMQENAYQTTLISKYSREGGIPYNA